LVLDTWRDGTFHMNGNPSVKIYGGPSKSVQVNSTSTSSLQFIGNPAHVDLSLGGPNIQGSTFGATGIQSSTIVTAASCASSPDICIGTQGGYSQGTRPILDPFATLAAPAIPTNVPPSTPPKEPAGSRGCPATASGGCDRYDPGYYPNGINVTGYAIFAPGIYYVKQGLNFLQGSCVRPAQMTGDGSGGTFFYLADGNSLFVKANAGCSSSDTPFSTTSGSAPYTLGARCDTLSPASPSNLPATLTGSVLLAPCLAPTVTSLCDPNCNINGGTGYGDPFGAADPAGITRGMLFMQNRAVSASPLFQGGGEMLLSGSWYFHQCHTSGLDTGVGCDATNAFTTKLSLGGNPAGSSYILGNIIVDQLDMSGTPDIYMDLSPQSLYFIYKASLLQ
jgi:hypothetical protein